MPTGLARRFGRCMLPTALLITAIQMSHPAIAADSLSETRDTCSLAGGSSTQQGDLYSCCWPGWGCVHCHLIDGQVDANFCWVDCDSQACSDANARGRLGLPASKRPPHATTPGTAPDKVAPPQTNKPKAPAAPGMDAVQP